LIEFFHQFTTTPLQTVNIVDNIRVRRSQKFNPIIKISHIAVQVLPVLGKLLLTLPFIQPILGFLEYELPILDERNWEHLRLEVFRKLTLNLLENNPDRLGILHKLVEVLVQ
jgi:hypothetical protein